MELQTTTKTRFEVRIKGSSLQIVPIKIRGRLIEGYAKLDEKSDSTGKIHEGLYVKSTNTFFPLEKKTVMALKKKIGKLNDKIVKDKCVMCGRTVPFLSMEYDSNYGGYLCRNCERKSV